MKETLYSVAKNGTTDMWTIEVLNNAIHTTYGKVDGKQQQKVNTPTPRGGGLPTSAITALIK